MEQKDRQKRFEDWMARHMAILHHVVNGFAEGEDRKDLMQDVMLAVWKAIPAFREESQPTTFLYRVSHNAALTWRRSQHSYSKRIEQAEALSRYETSSNDEAGTDGRLEHLYAAIRRLPELDRSLILLYLDGVSYQQMADIHGLTQSNVGVKISRIKQQLLQIMNEEKK